MTRTDLVQRDDIDGHELGPSALLQHLVDLQTALIERVPGVVDVHQLQFRVLTRALVDADVDADPSRRRRRRRTGTSAAAQHPSAPAQLESITNFKRHYFLLLSTTSSLGFQYV